MCHGNMRPFNCVAGPDVADITVVNVREVNTGTYSLSGDADLSCDFEVFVHKAHAYTLDGAVHTRPRVERLLCAG